MLIINSDFDKWVEAILTYEDAGFHDDYYIDINVVKQRTRFNLFYPRKVQLTCSDESEKAFDIVFEKIHGEHGSPRTADEFRKNTQEGLIYSMFPVAYVSMGRYFFSFENGEYMALKDVYNDNMFPTSDRIYKLIYSDREKMSTLTTKEYFQLYEI